MNLPMGSALRNLVNGRGHGHGAVTVLDLGTSRICCLIARRLSDGAHRIIGRGFQHTDGLRNGEVIDTEAVEASVQAALHEAEQESGETVRDVVAVTSAGRPRSELVQVVRRLDGATVTQDDIRRAVLRARDDVITRTRTVLHALPVEAAVDEGKPVRDPRGLSGDKLTVLVHLVVADSQPLRNVQHCLERCFVDVREVLAPSYMAGLGSLTDDEFERGCLVIDFGAGAARLAHFAQRRLLYVDQIDRGGARISSDLAHELKTNGREAERLKTLYGSVQWRSCDDHVRVAVPLIGDLAHVPTGEVPRTRLTTIVRGSVQSILEDLVHKLRESGSILRARPPRSIVLTGGSSQIEGLDELVEDMVGLPARIGHPRDIRRLHNQEEDPSCTAAAGALNFFSGEGHGVGWSDSAERRKVKEGIARIREWVRQNF